MLCSRQLVCAVRVEDPVGAGPSVPAVPGWRAYYALYDMAAPPETVVPAVENLNCSTGSQVSVIATALTVYRFGWLGT